MKKLFFLFISILFVSLGFSQTYQDDLELIQSLYGMEKKEVVDDSDIVEVPPEESVETVEDIEDQEVLITFQGPQDYVSPSWYTSPGVPTWNYQSVHIYGKPQLITEKEKLSNLVNKFTERYEADFEKPWKPEYKESMLNSIIGIEIIITDIQCKYKLSQNRSELDRRQVVDQLKANHSIQLAEAMQRRELENES